MGAVFQPPVDGGDVLRSHVQGDQAAARADEVGDRWQAAKWMSSHSGIPSPWPLGGASSVAEAGVWLIAATHRDGAPRRPTTHRCP